MIGDLGRNDVRVRREPGRYRVSDAAGALVAQAPCVRVGADVDCQSSAEVALVRVELRAGADRVELLNVHGATQLFGQDGSDALRGGPGADALDGGDGDDDLDGRGGPDTLDGGRGPDALDGGDGPDTLVYPERSVGVRVDLQTGEGGGAPDVVTNLIGVTRRDTLREPGARRRHHRQRHPDRRPPPPTCSTGVAGTDLLSGRAGDDRLDGGQGADVLIGDEGRDTATYADRREPVTVTLDGVANDGAQTDFALDDVRDDVEAVEGGAGDDRLTGSRFANQLDGNGGDDTLDGAGGADDVAGGAGRDSVSYGGRADPVTVSLDGIADDGNALDLFADNLRADVENVTGTFGDDVLRGSDADNTLDGLFGDNRLDGLGGNDTLTASNRGSDVLDGGDGIDTTSYSGTGFDGVTVTLDGLANDGAVAGAGVPPGGEADNALTENVVGSAFADVITGNDDSNRLAGAGGDDILHGGRAGDTLLGGSDRDTLLGEAGVDVLNANDGFPDQVDCGPDPDVANLDLQDSTAGLRGGLLLPATAGCETQNAAPSGQLPNVMLARTTIQVDHRRAPIALRCPRRAKRHCSGSLRLRRPHGTSLGRAHFSIPRGRRAIVTLRLRRDARPGPALIRTRERDATGRPKHTLIPVRLR